MCLLMDEGTACGGLPFSGTGCPIWWWQSSFVMYLTFMFGILFLFFYFNHLPRMFLYTDLAFRMTDWTCCHGPHLHAILRIISRGVSGLATDSPCGVWGRGWTTCSCMVVHFLAHISKWELVCTFGVIFHIFTIISCLGSRFHAWN